MKYRTLIKSFVVVVFISLLVFILSEFKPRKEINSLEAFEPDGIEMKYLAFNKNNQKSLEVNCAESKRAENDKTIMKKIRGTIFKKGRLDQDIHITADRGYATNNINNFFIERNATIYSEDLEIKSDHFNIKGRNKLSTEKNVQYQARGLKGIARKGLEFYIKTNVLKLFDTEGTYTRDNQTFDYQTSLLWVIDKNHSIIFKTGTEIKGPDMILKSDDLVLFFDDEFKQMKQSKSNRNSHLFREIKAEGETIIINSKILNGFYTTSGKLKKALARRNARLNMKDPENHTDISAHLINMEFNPESGQIIKAWMSETARVKNRGKSNFNIAAPEIQLWFREGDITKGEASQDCSFEINGYQGQCNKMTYELDKNLIHLQGAESTLKRDRNTFIADDFSVDTQKDILSSDQNIKSIIIPELKNALFSQESVFIHSRKIEIFHKENKILYQEGVRLQQDKTILTADSLEIFDQNKMEARGKVNLLFDEKEEVINLRGDHLIFDPQEKTIIIKENAVLKSKDRTLQAKYVRISFNKDQELENIYGENEVRFSKDQIQGGSKKVNWDYKKEIMLFLDTAQLKSRNQGITRGDKLRLNLKDNKITILSELQKRSETIIE